MAIEVRRAKVVHALAAAGRIPRRQTRLGNCRRLRQPRTHLDQVAVAARERSNLIQACGYSQKRPRPPGARSTPLAAQIGTKHLRLSLQADRACGPIANVQAVLCSIYEGTYEYWTRGPDAHPEPAAAAPNQNGQFPGLGTSIRRIASAGISWTAMVRASTVPSLRMMCTWSPPGSTNPIPSVYTVGLQSGSSPI